MDSHFESLQHWFLYHVLTFSTSYQLAIVLVTFWLSHLSARLLSRSSLGALTHRLGPAFGSGLGGILPWSIWWLLLFVALSTVAQFKESPLYVLRTAVSLLTAWIIVRIFTGFIRDRALSRFIAIIIWVVAALAILGFAPAIIEALDALGFQVGDSRVTVLSIVKGGFFVLFLLWAGHLLTTVIMREMLSKSTLDLSLTVLFEKVIRVSVFSLAILIGLSTVGIDLSVLALMGGALGLGLGFGLQKVISNFVCGVILLLDRSIKPGAVIVLEDGETFGWVNRLGARCVSMRTREGEEHLIPNETFITQRVENWSYSDNNIRVRVPIGVSYNADVRKAISLCQQATGEIPRILSDPPPVCHLTGFGDSSVDLELRFWVGDPEQGLGNVKSAVLLRVWDLFKENEVEIPFPQRDIHIRSGLNPPDIKRNESA